MLPVIAGLARAVAPSLMRGAAQGAAAGYVANSFSSGGQRPPVVDSSQRYFTGGSIYAPATNDNASLKSASDILRDNRSPVALKSANDNLEAIKENDNSVLNDNNSEVLFILRNIEKNTEKTSEKIQVVAESFDALGIDNLRAREGQIESGNEYIASPVGMRSSMASRDNPARDKRDNNQQEEGGILDGVITTVGSAIMAGGAALAEEIGEWMDWWKDDPPPKPKPKPNTEPARLPDPAPSINTDRTVEYIDNPDVVRQNDTSIYSNERIVVRKNDGMPTMELTEKEITDLIKTVQTEWVQTAGEDQAKGVIDTILNRRASGHWGDTITDVVNAKKQFSGINGPPAWKEGIHSVDDIKDSQIDEKVRTLVESYLMERANGAPSIIGNNLNYANPHYSSKRNLEWINKLEGPRLGVNDAIHYHGTTPELNKYRPDDFRVELPNQRTISGGKHPFVLAMELSRKATEDMTEELKKQQASSRGAATNQRSANIDTARENARRISRGGTGNTNVVNNNNTTVVNNSPPKKSSGSKHWWEDLF